MGELELVEGFLTTRLYHCLGHGASGRGIACRNDASWSTKATGDTGLVCQVSQDSPGGPCPQGFGRDAFAAPRAAPGEGASPKHLRASTQLRKSNLQSIAQVALWTQATNPQVEKMHSLFFTRAQMVLIYLY